MASNGLHAKYTGLLWINTALSASSYFQHGWLFRHDIMQLTTHTHTHTKRNHCNHKAPDLDPNTARFRCQNPLLTCLTTANIILLCVTLKTTFSVAEFCFLVLEACSGRASRGFLIEARLWSWPICRTASSLTRHTHARTLFTAWNLERRSGLVRREKEKRGCGSQREGWREKGKQQNRKNYLFRGKSVGRLEIVEVSCCSSFLTPWLSHDKDSKNFSSGSRAWWQLLILHTSRHDGRFDSDRGSLFLATPTQRPTSNFTIQTTAKLLQRKMTFIRLYSSGVTLLNMCLHFLPWDSWQEAKKLWQDHSCSRCLECTVSFGGWFSCVGYISVASLTQEHGQEHETFV